MRDALSILSPATVLPPSAATPCQHRRRHRNSSSTTTNTPSKLNPKSKPQLATSPLLSYYRCDNRQSLRYYTELASKLAEDGRFEDFLMIVESLVASGVEPSEFLGSLNGKNVASGLARALGEGKFDYVVKTLLHGVQKFGTEPSQLFDVNALESLRRGCRRLVKSGEVERAVSCMETLAGKIR